MRIVAYEDVTAQRKRSASRWTDRGRGRAAPFGRDASEPPPAERRTLALCVLEMTGGPWFCAERASRE